VGSITLLTELYGAILKAWSGSEAVGQGVHRVSVQGRMILAGEDGVFGFMERDDPVCPPEHQVEVARVQTGLPAVIPRFAYSQQ